MRCNRSWATCFDNFECFIVFMNEMVKIIQEKKWKIIELSSNTQQWFYSINCNYQESLKIAWLNVNFIFNTLSKLYQSNTISQSSKECDK